MQGQRFSSMVIFLLLFLALPFILAGATHAQVAVAPASTNAAGDTPGNTYLPLLTTRYPIPPHLTINEVLYYEEENGIEWVELFNPTDTPIALAGWRLTNVDLSLNVALPAWTLPKGAYLVVYFGQGQNDANFSDGRGAYYTGATQPVLDNEEDGVALYRGNPKARNLVDFVAWSVNGRHQGGTAMTHAVNSGQWQDGDFYAALNMAPIYLTMPVLAGDSIGRNADSLDTNRASDWDSLGGVDSLGPTPGERNLGALTPTNVVDALPRVATTPNAAKPWTIMVFMDGRDRTIRNEQWRDINLMERVGSNSTVNIVVQMMDARGFTFRCFIRRDNQPSRLTSPCVRVRGVVNPGDPRALSNFLTWASTNYPSQKRSLILDGHGAGWKGLFPSAGDPLTMSELRTALSTANLALWNIMFVACLMGQFEVADQIQAWTMTMTASEEVTYAVFPYDVFLNELTANPGWTDTQYARRAAELYAQRLARITNRYTMAAYLMSMEPVVDLQIDTMALKLRQDVENYRQHDVFGDNLQLVIKHNVRQRVQSFQDRNYIDLRHFAQLVAAQPLSAAREAQRLANMLAPGPNNFILWEQHGPGVPNANGVSIYFPASLNGYDHKRCRRCNDWEDRVFDDPWPSPHLYQRDTSIKIPRLISAPHALPDDPDFLFPRGNRWDEFLHRYYKPVADACIRPPGGGCVESIILEVGERVTLSGLGSSDSDGPENDGRAISTEWAVGPRQGNDRPAHLVARKPKHWYWDFYADLDTGGNIPNYREGVKYERCTSDDCDRNEVDNENDDRDAVGVTVPYECPREGTFVITLWVWDEHHDQSRRHREDRRHNLGRHWLHFNVDSETVTISCYEPERPVKIADRSTVQPGDKIHYLVNLPPNPSAVEPGFGSMAETLPPFLQVTEITCNFGICETQSYGDQMFLTWEFPERPPELRIWMEYEVVFVPEDPPTCPPEIVNVISGWDGWQEISLESTVKVSCP